jgi:heat shock protein HslJ
MKYPNLIFCVFFSATLLILSACHINNRGNVATLEQGSWQLHWLLGKEINTNSQYKQPTIKFEPSENKATGFSGCNQYFTAYNQAGNKLTFMPLAMTRRYCAETAELESLFENTLIKVNQFKIEQGYLHLMLGNKVVMKFEHTNLEN